jgi:hypothetical protein
LQKQEDFNNFQVELFPPLFENVVESFNQTQLKLFPSKDALEIPKGAYWKKQPMVEN